MIGRHQRQPESGGSWRVPGHDDEPPPQQRRQHSNTFSADAPSMNSYYTPPPQHRHYLNNSNSITGNGGGGDDNSNNFFDQQQRNEHEFTTSRRTKNSWPQSSNNGHQSNSTLGILLTILFLIWGSFSGSSSSSSILDSTWNFAASTIPGFSRLAGGTKLGRRLSRGLGSSSNDDNDGEDFIRPDFVYEHPYVSSSYYTSTKSIKTLLANEEIQVKKNLLLAAEEEREAAMQATAIGGAGGNKRGEIKTRLAIVRPFCEFDAEALPSTFSCWNGLPPCKAAREDIGDDYEDENEEDMYELNIDGELVAYKRNSSLGGGGYDDEEEDRHLFDFVGSDAMKNAVADVFLFYSQTFSENEVAIKAVDTIIDQFFEPGGWSQCFANIYAIEANIPQELDLYIPSAQEELYNWVNGPNRQYEAAFRIIQSGEWGEYDGFYLMEGDSVPIKAHWLDVVLSEIEKHRPFAVLGAQYDGDKWDNFYEKIPISLLHHTNGNAIYNTSHPLLERLVGQLEIEAPCPYNSIPYDYRMSQMWVEGTLGIVPTLAPKIMLNEEGENITLSNNLEMFKKWADIWEKEIPYKFTPVIHNYAATNLIPRHLGPEYIIHGAKLYSPWDPTKTEITLVISEWFYDRSLHLIKNLDEKDHPFSQVVVMVPPVAGAREDYDQLTSIPVRTQHRGSPDYMDLCDAEVTTDWFMITNSYHQVARHVDLMFTPGKFQPVIPFTPATLAFCFKFPYCKETINLAQRINPGHDKVILDMDMLYHTESRNAYCKEWKEANGEEGEDLYKHQQRRLMFRKKIIGPSGPTGTSYFAWMVREKKDDMYKMTDRSLYGARPPFIKVFSKEEKLDGMSADERAKRVGMTLMDNTTDCNCGAYETEVECTESGIGCLWRPLFESCHPPELIDGSEPICPSTEAPTMAPTLFLEDETESPSPDVVPPPEDDVGPVPESDPWYISMFKSREHDAYTSETNTTEDFTLMADDDDAIPGSEAGPTQSRKLQTDSYDPFYQTNLFADQRLDTSDVPRRKLQTKVLDDLYVTNAQAQTDATTLPMKVCNSWNPTKVPRNRTKSNIWDGPSLDPESRSFSAMSTSRPRKLYGSYLRHHHLTSQEQFPDLLNILDDSSAMKYSWQTSTVPINIPKYAAFSDGRKTNVPLDPPEIDHKTFVNYENDNYQPIRITFATDHLLDFSIYHKSSNKNEKRSQSVTMATISRIETLTGDILPAVAETWASAISVLQSDDNMFPYGHKCGAAEISSHHLSRGFPDTDIVIHVTVDGPQCYNDANALRIVSYSTVCSFDQHMRPISANIDLCLENVDLSFGDVSDKESLRLTGTLTVEVGKILGLSPALFRYFRNPLTKQPYGSTERTVRCVDGAEETLFVPNILQSASLVEDIGRWEVTTPTVRQVVRNHFDCQSLLGARLSQSGSSSCFGDFFDPRYHFDDNLAPSGGSADMAYSLSPLTLALLEDSGWYRVNFEKSTVPLFGRGAGCGFVEGNCVGPPQTKLPDYSQGYFCNDQDRNISDHPSGCDYTHNHKADCMRFEESESSNCPMQIENIKSCSDQANTPFFTGEVYSVNSRCFVTDTPFSICLESYCNSIDSKIDIVVNEKVFQCDYEGQEINLGQEYTVKCPRLATVCPHLVCPANCSGRGVCDYCLEVPQCLCEDPFDKTAGCYGDISQET